MIHSERETLENNTILRNDAESVKYRRNLNNLVVLGTGVILFGFWGLIKLIAQSLLGIQIFEPSLLDGLPPIWTVITMFLIAAMFSLDVILRLYAGLRAIREARGKKTRSGYLTVSVILIFGSFISIASVIFSILTATGELEENFVMLFMELSSLVLTLEMFMASVSVRKYRKRTGAGVKQHAG